MEVIRPELAAIVAGRDPRDTGFDATQGQSMATVAPPADRPEVAPRQAANVLAKMVYLPIYAEMSERAVRKMARVVLSVSEPPQFLHLAEQIEKE